MTLRGLLEVPTSPKFGQEPKKNLDVVHKRLHFILSMLSIVHRLQGDIMDQREHILIREGGLCEDVQELLLNLGLFVL